MMSISLTALCASIASTVGNASRRTTPYGEPLVTTLAFEAVAVSSMRAARFPTTLRQRVHDSRHETMTRPWRQARGASGGRGSKTRAAREISAIRGQPLLVGPEAREPVRFRGIRVLLQ